MLLADPPRVSFFPIILDEYCCFRAMASFGLIDRIELIKMVKLILDIDLLSRVVDLVEPIHDAQTIEFVIKC